MANQERSPRDSDVMRTVFTRSTAAEAGEAGAPDKETDGMVERDARTATGLVIAPARDPAVLALLLGAVVAMMNVSISSVAAAPIVAGLGASGVQVHLLASGYAIALASTLLLAGAIGDAYGRKRLYLAGLLVLALTALLAAHATSANELIVWRLASGVAAAMVLPTTLSALTDLFPEGRERFHAVSLWAGVTAAASALAPALSGLILRVAPWNAVFAVSAPLCLLAAAIGWRTLPLSRNPGAASPDWIGGIAAAVFAASVLLLVILLPVNGLQAPAPAVALAALVGGAGLLVRERTAANPLLNLAAFRQREFSTGALTVFVLYTAEAGALYLAIRYAQDLLAFDPLASGLVLLPLSLTVFLVSPRTPALVERFGSRWLVLAGLACVALALALTMAARPVATARLWPLLGLLLLIGAGIGLAYSSAAAMILHGAPPGRIGVGSAISNLAKHLGLALGVAMNGALVSATRAAIEADAFAGLSTAYVGHAPDTVYRLIRSSLTGPRGAVGNFAGPASDRVLTVSRDAFVGGQQIAALASLALCLLGMVVVWRWAPTDYRPTGANSGAQPPTGS